MHEFILYTRYPRSRTTSKEKAEYSNGGGRGGVPTVLCRIDVYL